MNSVKGSLSAIVHLVIGAEGNVINSELDAQEIEKLISAYRLGKKQVVHAI